jgi:hypothetical protein
MASSSVIQGFFPSGLGRLVQPTAAAQRQAVQRVAAQPAARQSPTGTTIALPPHLAKFGFGRGMPLAPQVRQMMENVFRTSFAAVTIHTGPHVSTLGALAFTRGSEIHFAPGQYDPASPRGRHLLAHELAHVVQQRSGRVPNPFGGGVAVVQNFALEAEAERMAQRVAASPRIIQRMEAPKLNVATFLAQPARYVRQPADAEQQAIVNSFEFELSTRYAHEVLDWGLASSRLAFAAKCLALAGGRETYEVKLMAYLLGLRPDTPSRVFGGLGSLAISDEGSFNGRPGFVKGVFEESGGPGRHLRHESAHHTIQDVLNQITSEFGVDVLEELAEDAEAFVPAEVGEQITQWIIRSGQRFSKTEFRLLWLACALNNVKQNLWYGPGRENVSINSFGGPLKKWVEALDMGHISIADLDAKLAKSGVSSGKGKKIVALARGIIAAECAKPISYLEKVNRIVNEIFGQCIKPLEVDVKPGGVAHESSELLFQIANGAGDLGQALDALRKFLRFP